MKKLVLLLLVLTFSNTNAQFTIKIGPVEINPIAPLVPLPEGTTKKHTPPFVNEAYKEMEELTKKGLYTSLKLQGRSLKIQGDIGGSFVEIGEQGLNDLNSVKKVFGGIQRDALNLLTPEGKWRVNFGIFEVKGSQGLGDEFADFNSKTELPMRTVENSIIDVLKLNFEAKVLLGDFTENLATYLGLGVNGFPPIVNNPKLGMETEDIRLRLSKRYAKVVIERFMNQKFYFDTKEVDGKKVPKNPNNYVVFRSGTLDFKQNINSLILQIENGTISYEGDLTGSATIKSAKIQLLPYIVSEGDKLILKMGQRMVFFNMKHSFPDMDRALAWYVQKELFQEPLIESDITSLLDFQIDEEVKIDSDDMAILVSDDYLILKAKSKINEEDNN
ncbi:hypothetical protein [Flagellimonas flava]|uniref:hypothetical protein n=1 Tax=Flagellimonas flava TaxID=570519 RepID=UPI003D64BABB